MEFNQILINTFKLKIFVHHIFNIMHNTYYYFAITFWWHIFQIESSVSCGTLFGSCNCGRHLSRSHRFRLMSA